MSSKIILELFFKVINYEVTLKTSSLHTGKWSKMGQTFDQEIMVTILEKSILRNHIFLEIQIFIPCIFIAFLI